MKKKFFLLTEYSNEKAIFSMIFLCLLCAIMYIYFVSYSVVEVVLREEIIDKASILEGTISDKESKYIALKSSITETFAFDEGYVSLSNKQYVPIDVVPTLTINQ